MSSLIPFNRKKQDLLSSGFDDFHNMIDDFFVDGWPLRRSLASDTFKIDVQDNQNEYIIEAELPGVKKEEIEVSLEDGKLNISFKKEESKEEKEKNYIHRERRFSSMARTIFLQDSSEEDISAKLVDGVLKIKVPKREKVEVSKKIEIE